MHISLRWAWWLLCAAALFVGVLYFRYTTTWLGPGAFMSRDRVSGQVCFYHVRGQGVFREFCSDARPPDVPWPESSSP